MACVAFKRFQISSIIIPVSTMQSQKISSSRLGTHKSQAIFANLKMVHALKYVKSNTCAGRSIHPDRSDLSRTVHCANAKWKPQQERRNITSNAILGRAPKLRYESHLIREPGRDEVHFHHCAKRARLSLPGDHLMRTKLLYKPQLILAKLLVW